MKQNKIAPKTGREQIKLLDSLQVEKVFALFESLNPNPQTELVSVNPFTMLVSVILSAQATDKSVNKATLPLYQVADTPQKMVELGEENLIPYIKSIGLYRTKAEHVIQMSRMLIEKFDGVLPSTRENLMALPGVGRKTANVILNVVYGQGVMPVDTHILRIAPRIGLSSGTTPESVEMDLLDCIPSKYLKNAHHHLILHGRYVCTARNPKCTGCCIAELCKKNGLDCDIK